jgi:hypothetical protein
MTLREVTRTVIKRVEDASGCPVVVSEDASLKILAASRIARGLADNRNLTPVLTAKERSHDCGFESTASG